MVHRFERALIVLVAIVWAAPLLGFGPGASVSFGGRALQVQGTVVDETGNPVDEARIEFDANGMHLVTASDSAGRFHFNDVPVGEASLRATKKGFYGGLVGQGMAFGAGKKMLLPAGSPPVKVLLRLWKAAVLRGVVRNSDGAAVVGCTVGAFRQTVYSGREKWSVFSEVLADSKGAYRLEVPSGVYIVATSDPNRTVQNRLSCGPPAYYPGVAAAVSAAALTARWGDDLANVDVILPRVSSFRVAGRIDASLPNQYVRLELIHQPDAMSDLGGMSVPVGRDGSFAFTNVLAGDYRIESYVFPGNPGGPLQDSKGSVILPSPPKASSGPSDGYWLEDQIQVDRDLKDLAFSMRVGSHVSGDITLEQTGQRRETSYDGARILIERADGRELGVLPLTMIRGDGTFRTVGLPPGDYILRAQVRGFSAREAAAVGASREAIAVGMEDITSVSIELSNRPWARLTGTVQRPSGAPCANCLVFAFPTSPNLWVDYGSYSIRIQEAVSGADGEYSFGAVPPGTYFVATAPEADETWRRTDNLSVLAAAAIKVELTTGSTTRADLRSRR